MAFAIGDQRSMINAIGVAAGILGLVMDWWFAPNELAKWLFAVAWIVIVVVIVVAVKMSRVLAASPQYRRMMRSCPKMLKKIYPSNGQQLRNGPMTKA